MACLYLSAAHKSSGKTTVTLGLARALKQRGQRVQVFKKGPDYIDPIWHGLASGRPSYNLDFHMMQAAEIDALYAHHMGTADIGLVEGNKGLYDGMDLEGSNSNAALAKRLGVPVVLVLDCVGMTRGVAPLVLGYQAFDPAVQIAGVILNKVGGPRHEEKLRAVMTRYTRVPVLGVIPRDARLMVAERHLGLTPGNEQQDAEARIDAMAEVIKAQCDLDAVRAVAQTAVAPSVPPLAASLPRYAGLRLGYLHDRAFGFYYQEDLDTLRAAGVSLLPIDTLQDTRLPALDGLLMGGGFPEVFIETLAANTPLRTQLRAAIDAGLPTYAECGGLMYLAESIRWAERSGAMLGVIPATVTMGERPVGRGYASLRGTGASPLAAAGVDYPAHEFHYSALSALPDTMTPAYAMLRGRGFDGRQDGFVYKNLLASYCHRRGTGPQGWIAPFLKLCAQVAKLTAH
jgi:cobyrinic acid a,c-diamide synthase